MRHLLVVGMALAVSACATLDNWRTEDTVRQAVATGLFLIDRKQTTEIVKHPDIYWERNPLLGRHPSIGRVNTMTGISIVNNYYLVGIRVPLF